MSTFVIPHKLERVWKPSSPEDWAVVSATEDTLRQKIEAAFSTDKQLECSFWGFHKNPDREPSREYWKECNPALAFAIDKVREELVSKGWNPSMTLGRRFYSLDEDPRSGGIVMTVECDLH